MPKFCANLTMQFNEVDFLERFVCSKRAGFKAVEYMFPYDWSKDQLVEALESNGLTQVLHNLPAGNWAAGERGVAELSDNPIFLAIAQAMFNWLSTAYLDYHRDLLGIPELEDLTLKEHEDIFECIARRDADGAAKVISDHILRVNALYSQAEKETGQNRAS